jgi:hypothetical protein
MRNYPRWLPWALLAVLIVIGGGIVLWAGRETVFRGDDWDLLLYRGGFNANVFLVPHNEHLSALLVVAYKLIPAIFGPSYGVFRAALFVLDAIVALLFFVFARERVGDWVALILTAPFLVMGAGGDNLIWPTQIGVVGSLASGMGVVILLDREGLSARLGACALLTVSIWFSSDGLFFLACAAIWLGLSPKRWRDLWIVAVPLATYLAWYSGYGTSDVTSANLRATPKFVLDSAAGGVSALGGIRPDIPDAKLLAAVGAAVGLAALVALIVKAMPRPTPRLAALLALPLVSWVLIAVGRADGGDAFASRYVYASALFILMALLELIRELPIRELIRGWRLAALALLTLVTISLNVNLLAEYGDQWRGVAVYIHGRTAAVEIARRTVDPNMALEPLQDMGHMTAGWLLNADEKWGQSPTGAADPNVLPKPGRETVDQILAAADPAQFVAPPPTKPSGSAPTSEQASLPVTERGSCLSAPAGAVVEVEVPPSGLILRPTTAPLRVALRRYAQSYEAAPSKTVSRPTLLVIPSDLSDMPWRTELSANAAFAVCGTSAPTPLRKGPYRPPAGNQGCNPASEGEFECRFRRY